MQNATPTRLSLFGLLSTTVFAAAIGCGGDGGEPIALEDLGEQTAAAFCERAFNCCTEAELPDYFGGTAPSDVAACTTMLAPMFNTDEEQAALEAGTLSYSEDKAGDCLAEFKGISCGAELELDCEPFTGSVAIDGDCEINEECVDGAFCSDGVCLDEPELGDDCLGTFCSDGSACEDGVCVAPPAEGEECPGFQCEEGAWCDTAAQPATCAALLPVGDACTSAFQCESGNCDEVSGECAAESCDGA